jgi:aromatic ring-opening dioxygenase catalytic subunit (LigB family)
MATVALGAGLSHGPTVVLQPEIWAARAATEVTSPERTLNALDGRFLTHAERLAEVGPRHAAEATLENFRRQHSTIQRALDRLAADLAAARPDAIVVIGSDQDELYRDGLVPAIAVHHGSTVSTWKRDQSGYPEWRRAVTTAYAMDEVHHYPGASQLGRELVERLVERGFDVAASDAVPDPLRVGFGHAWGFVARRLFADAPPPMVPVLLNGFRPPNRPSAARCYALGVALRDAIESTRGAERVAILASGGLSHMLCEEDLDRRVLGAMLARDRTTLEALPMISLQSGSSEILAWIAMHAATRHLAPAWLEYVPVYRTAAGSGMGCAFGLWTEGER